MIFTWGEKLLFLVAAITVVIMFYEPMKRTMVKTMRKSIKKPTFNNNGFTLIEIVAVLVIMGILAAVAIPMFFDLQQRSRDKAIYTAMSEMKTRVNQSFGSQLLDGKPVGEINYVATAVGVNLGQDFLIENWVCDTGVDFIIFDITYFPDPTDHSKNPVTKVGQRLTKPQTD